MKLGSEALRHVRRGVAAFLCAAFLLGMLAGTAVASLLEITVTSPWLALLVNFIGGANVKVVSVQEWNTDGELTRKIKPRILQNLLPESLIIAFDFRDAKALGLPFEKYPNYRSLYESLPLEESRLDISLADPSVVPFIAQRILTVLADWDPSNYPYYQRRLAEFQARLYSTTLAGRQILKDQPVFDLTGYSGLWLQAAGCRLKRPTPEEWQSWASAKETEHLIASVNKNIANKVVVVVDHSTPKAIRNALSGIPEVFLFGRPRLDQEYPAFLHDQYISLWLKMTSKPLPVPPKRGKGVGNARN